MPEPGAPARRLRLVDLVASGLVLLLGAAHAAAAMRQGSMNEDGIGYLDAGAAWLRGDLANAVNGTWSPLYALLLSPATLDAVPLGVRFPLVHALDFLIFVGAFVAFRFAWRELGRAADRHAAARPDTATLPPLLRLLVGHALFAVAALTLIEMWTVTPDMLLAGLLLAAAALLLRHRDRPARPVAFSYGLVLGLGYLAKPVMFPLGLVFLVVAGLAWSAGRPRRAWLGSLGAAAGGFLLLALPWATALSLERGEPTFGESGTLTYIRYVNDVSYPFWTDGGSAAGEPVHPAPRVAENPDVWAFGDPAVGGTYPPGFDPAHWYRGVEPRLDARRQLEELAANTAFTFELLVRRLGLPLGGLLVLLWLSGGPWGGRRPRLPSTAAGPTAVLALGAAGIVLYLPVLAEGRYLGVFVVLAFGGALALVRVPALRGGEVACRAAGWVMLAGLLLELVAFNLAGAAQIAGLDVAPRGGFGFGAVEAAAGATESEPGVGESAETSLRHGTDDHVAVARALAGAGVEPGTRIGVIGWAFDSYWAWLADLRIVAEMPEDQAVFWAAEPERRAALEAAFAGAGARVLVAEVRPAELPDGWEHLAGTGLAVRRLPAPP